MAKQQARLLGSPSRDDDGQEAQQGAEEVAVEGDLVGAGRGDVGGVDGDGSTAGGALGDLTDRDSLLLRDGMADAVDKGDEQGEADGA